VEKPDGYQASESFTLPSGGELRALYEFTDAIYRARCLDDIYTAALDAITQTLGCERASILLFDAEGTMRFVAWRGLSDRYRHELEGHTPWQPGDIDPAPIFVSDILDTDEPDWIKQVISAEGIVSLGFIPLTLGGRVIGKFMTYYDHRQPFGEHGKHLAVTIARQLGFSIGRARAEASREAALADLRMSEARFRLMSEQAPVMIWMSDERGHCQHLNRMSREFWGVDEGMIDQFDWTATIHAEDIADVTAQMGRAVASHQPVMLRGRYANSQGEWRTLQTEAHPRFSGDGMFLGMIGVNVDMTEQESLAKQRELMLAELNHRVKNTLAVVQAIAHQTFKNERSSAPVQAFNGRLAVLAKAHNMLSRVNWESTPLRQLASEVLASSPENFDRVLVEGPPIQLPPKQALAIALALHELQTNALKYGALSVDGGSVFLRWQTAAAARLEIVWQESGGPPVNSPIRRGFGTMMIEHGLAADLEGAVHLDFKPEGLVCRIDASCNYILQ
jgi:PAS domain S-box-containing protein